MRRLIVDPGLESDLAHAFEYLLDINSAHVVMLVECDLLDLRAGGLILGATGEIRSAGPEALRLDPALEDLYFNLEANLMARVGNEIGGKLHLARSRNDMLATAARLRMRDEIIDACSKLLSLRRTLLRLASEHTRTIVSGYTHLQAGEPITLGHYFSAALHALERDYHRLEACLAEVSACPLGSGALASTTFDIDRTITAELLGFESVMGNSLDAVASRDYLVDSLGALALLANNLGRFAQDLYVWSTGEFGFVDVEESIATTSSIMPQKKNPVALEHIKSKVAHLQASWSSCLGALKGTHYSHSRESSVEAQRFVWDGIQEARTAVELFEHSVRNMSFDGELMKERAAVNFSCVTELANELVRDHGLAFRTAHDIVGSLVARCVSSGKTARDIDPTMLREVSGEFLGSSLDVSADLISRALDPAMNVEGRLTRGGPSAREVGRQLDRLGRVLNDDEATLNAATARHAKAADCLRQRSKALTDGRMLA